MADSDSDPSNIEIWLDSSKGGRKYLSEEYKRKDVFLKDLQTLEAEEGNAASTMIKNYGTMKGKDGTDALTDYIDKQSITPLNTQWKKEIVGKINTRDTVDKLEALKSGEIDADRKNYEDSTLESIDKVYESKLKILTEKLFSDDKRTVIEKARYVNTRQEAERLYSYIDSNVPSGPERDKQIVELNEIVNNQVLTREEEYLNEVSSIDDPDRIRDMLSSAPTVDAEDIARERISKLRG